MVLPDTPFLLPISSPKCNIVTSFSIMASHILLSISIASNQMLALVYPMPVAQKANQGAVETNSQELISRFA